MSTGTKLFKSKLIPGTPSVHTAENAEARAKQALIVELKTAGKTFAEIAEELDCSVAYVHKRYKRAMNMVIVENIDQVRKTECRRLDKMHAEATRILNMSHPLVQQGRIVKTPLLDENGREVLDENGAMIFVPLEDVTPKLNAMAKILHIMERRAKLLGLDMPSKTAFTDPSGENSAPVVQFYIPNNGRNTPQLEAPESEDD